MYGNVRITVLICYNFISLLFDIFNRLNKQKFVFNNLLPISQRLLIFNNLSPLYTLSAVTRTLHLQSVIRSASESDENPAN